MPEFVNFSNEQLFEKRAQIHEELGHLLGVRAELSVSRPSFYDENGKPDASGYYDRLTEVEMAIDVCTNSIHKIWAHFKYRDISVEAQNGFSEQIFAAAAKEDDLPQLEAVTELMPVQDQYDSQPDIAIPVEQAA